MGDRTFYLILKGLRHYCHVTDLHMATCVPSSAPMTSLRQAEFVVFSTFALGHPNFFAQKATSSAGKRLGFLERLLPWVLFPPVVGLTFSQDV